MQETGPRAAWQPTTAQPMCTLGAGPACRRIDSGPVAPLAGTAGRRCGNGITAPKWSGSRGQRRWRTLMDDDRFDAWTRRRFGRAAAASLASLCIAATPHAADAARCRKLGSTCTRNGKRCCGSLKCDQTVVNGSRAGSAASAMAHMHLGRAMLLRHLRLPRQRRHLRPVPRSHLRCRSAMLWWSRLYRRLLRRLPRPRDLLHQLVPVLLQRLHGRRLSVSAGRTMCS